MKSGFVSIIGRPNTGKSTLLNAIVNAKVAITSKVPGTTRNTIEGIYNDDDSQIIFIDTPGIHKPQSKLGKYLNKEAYSVLKDIDVILFIIDGTKTLGPGDEFILKALKNDNIPVILVINKIDKIKDVDLVALINDYANEYPFSEVVPISALTEKNVDELIKTIKTYLTDSIKYYENTQITNLDPKFMISELVREKILRLTNDEVPHCVTCYTVNYRVKKEIVEVYVDIVVDRSSLKKIIIGKNGEMLKKIGTLARADIEAMFDKKVYLELYCKTVENWKERDNYLKEFGFISKNE